MMPQARDLRLVMMGTGTFAEPTFRALLEAQFQVVGLVTQPDRVVGAQRGSTRQVGVGMKTIAEQHGIAVFQPESINTPEGVAGLAAFRPDLLVVAAYGQILSKEVLGTATQGGINVHASLLPKYRGAAPIAWAIYHGERRTGVTIIRMSVALDAGDMVAQEAIDILPDETAGELEARLAPLGGQMAVRVIEQLVAGTLQGQKQDKSLVTRAPKLTKDHGLIDWTRTAEQVCCQVRAMQPWPTAYTFRHRATQPPARLLIQQAHLSRETAESTERQPGRLHATASAPLLVEAGDGRLVEISKLQPEGKRPMTATEYCNGRPVQPGDFFGPEIS